MAEGPPAQDLRSKLQALLEGSQPRVSAGPPRRRPHPLYNGGSAASGSGSTSGKQRRGGSQPGSARRSKSNPPSPVALCKTRPPRSGTAAALAAAVCASARRRGGTASAGASPDRQLGALNFGGKLPLGSGRESASAPNSPSQLVRWCSAGPSPASSGQLLPDFGRLRLISPGVTPQTSPRPHHSVAEAGQGRGPFVPPAGQASQPDGPRWPGQQQAQRAQQGPESPGSSEESWTVPASLEVCCNQLGWAGAVLPIAPGAAGAAAAQQPTPTQPSARAAAAAAGSSAVPTPLDCDWGSQQQTPPAWHQPQAAAAAAAAAAGPAEAPPGASCSAGMQSSPFGSSQERWQEIALLSEMAQDVAGTWSSQQAEMPAADQQQEGAGRQRQHSDGPDADVAAAPAAALPPWHRSQASGGHGASGEQAAALSQVAQPYIGSLTSQQLSELDDPWSQLAQQAEQGRRQMAAQQGGQPAAEWLHEGRGPAIGEESVQRQRQDASAPHQPSWRRCYQQRGPAVNQWAVVGARGSDASHPHAQQHQQQHQHQHQQQGAGSMGPSPLTPRSQSPERGAAGGQLVASTCPAPALMAVREQYGTQREAFAAADRHNQRCMPPLRQPAAVLMSAVPQEQLLRTGGPAGSAGNGSSAGQQQQQQAAAAASSSSTGNGGQHGRDAQEAEPAGQEQQQQAAPAAPPDFLSRFQAGILPPSGCTGYAAVPVAPAPKRQRGEDEEDEEARKQREEANRAAGEQFRRALADLQRAAEADAAAAQQQLVGQQHQHQQQQGQPLAGGGGDGPGQAGGAPRHGSAAAAAAAAEGRHEEAVRAFCVEQRARSGTYYRCFYAASYPAVWAWLRRTPGQQRHWYEVVREGRPAHLYFDLEYPAQYNPQADGDALVDCLLRRVEEQLRRHWGLSLDRRCVYELDSTTPEKFSRHLTLRLPGHAFANNHAMGKFVAQVLAASGSELQVVRSVQEGGAQMGSLVDTAVYSKNRHWRMSFCCKGGKAAVLRPTRRFATAEGAVTSPAAVFLDTLVCNVDPRARLLQMPDPLPQLAGPGGRGSGGNVALGATGAVLAAPGGGLRVAWKHEAADAVLPPQQLAELKQLAGQAVPFIERVASQRAGGAAAHARTLAFCGSGTTVAYSMIGPGSHYCENIGRPHASNHVFFVADFHRGVYAQKCHDPDCARFRSGWMPLPPQLCLQEPAGAGGSAGGWPPSPQASSRRSAHSR